MRAPAAKHGDEIRAVDKHEVLLPTPSGGTKLLLHIFTGVIDNGLSSDVRINGRVAAVVGSTATNIPHIPTPPGISFPNAPKNQGTIDAGSGTVRINGKPAARHGDAAITCNDPSDARVGSVVATGTVRIG